MKKTLIAAACCMLLSASAVAQDPSQPTTAKSDKMMFLCNDKGICKILPLSGILQLCPPFCNLTTKSMKLCPATEPASKCLIVNSSEKIDLSKIAKLCPADGTCLIKLEPSNGADGSNGSNQSN